METVIPSELTRMRQWIGTGTDKKPIPAVGWQKTENHRLYNEIDNVPHRGFVLMPEDGFLIIDLDDPDKDARSKDCKAIQSRILDTFVRRTFVERSMSGKGYHIVCRGKLPNGKSMKSWDDIGVEFFGWNKQVVLTGRKLDLSPDTVLDCQEDIDRFFNEFQSRGVPTPLEKAMSRPCRGVAGGAAGAGTSTDTDTLRNEFSGLPADVRSAINHISKATNRFLVPEQQWKKLIWSMCAVGASKQLIVKLFCTDGQDDCVAQAERAYDQFDPEQISKNSLFYLARNLYDWHDVDDDDIPDPDDQANEFDLMKLNQIDGRSNIDWICSPLCLAHGKLTMLYGREKTGKSYLKRQFIAASLEERPFCQTRPPVCDFVYLVAEEGESEVKGALEEIIGDRVNQSNLYWMMPPARRYSPADYLQRVEQSISQLSGYPVIVIIDSLTMLCKNVFNVSMQSDEAATLIHQLADLAHRSPWSFWVLHHEVKDRESTEARDATAILAAFDYIVRFQRDVDEDGDGSGTTTLTRKGRRIDGQPKLSYDTNYRPCDHPVRKQTRNRKGQMTKSRTITVADEEREKLEDLEYRRLVRSKLELMIGNIADILTKNYPDKKTMPTRKLIEDGIKPTGLSFQNSYEQAKAEVIDHMSRDPDPASGKLFYAKSYSTNAKQNTRWEIGLNRPPTLRDRID